MSIFFFLLLSDLEPLDLLLLLFLTRLLDFLDFFAFLREKNNVDEGLELAGELLRLDAETLACPLCGVLDRALVEVLKGAVTGMLAVTASPSAGDGGPGGTT